MSKKNPEINLSTEEKIKEAARIVFTKKGYAATKTRDIAEQAGLNLALLNYYFRSKEKLFEMIMLEKVQQLFHSVAPDFNDEATSLEEKIDRITSRYIELLLEHPDLPLFVLSEIRNNPERLGQNIQLKSYILKSRFLIQLAERRPDINPMQLLTSFIGMVVFPFISKPVFLATNALDEETFSKLMDERKQLIPSFFKLILGG